MKILLTGANGFVGSKVLEKLIEINDVKDIYILSGKQMGGSGGTGEIQSIPSLDYEFNDDYLCEYSFDVIIHVGAFTPKAGNEADKLRETTSNIQNTERLLEAARKCENLKKFIFISTLDVYVETEEELSELTVTIPQTMYGWSKLYCEQMVKTFARQNEIEYEILRLGHVYGEGEEKYRKVMPVMIRSAIEGNDITIFGDGEALRTFIYIDDVAEAIVRSVEYEASDIINVVGREPVSINDLAQMIVRLSGGNVQIKHVVSDAPNRNICFDNSKLMDSLLSSLTPLEVGLKKEIDYMKSKMS